jgi:hypothetical protein
MTLCTACAATPPTVYDATQLGSAHAAVTSSRLRTAMNQSTAPKYASIAFGTAPRES